MFRLIIYMMFIFGVAGPWFYGARCMADKVFGSKDVEDQKYCPGCGKQLR